MLAQKQTQSTHDYGSDRVYDGARPVSRAMATKLRANYQRTHTTKIYRVVAQVTRLFGYRTVHGN